MVTSEAKIEEIEKIHKSEQVEAIKAIFLGKYIFVILPTGYEKSFCYQSFANRPFDKLDHLTA